MALGTQIYVYDPTSGDLTDITADIGAGFGDPFNKYTWSGTLFDSDNDGVDELYVGTWSAVPDIAGAINFAFRALYTNDGVYPIDGVGLDDYASPVQSNGGEVWKYDFATETWTVVLDASHPGLSVEDVGVREIIEFDGKLYATTANPGNISDETVKMFVSDDGEKWSSVKGGVLDPDLGHNSIRTMKVVQDPNGEDVLMVATSNYEQPSQIWTYSKAGTWTLIADTDQNTISDIFVDENGDIYATTWQGYNLYKVDQTLAGTPGAVTDVTPNVSLTDGPDTDDGIIEITYFDGYYYIGSANYGGTLLIRSADLDDPDSWEVITTDGFYTYGADQSTPGLQTELQAAGAFDIEYTWQMYVVEDYLYIATFTGNEAVVLRSDTGTDWEIVDAEFEDEAYGLRTMLPVALDENGLPTDGDANALIFGTANNWAEFPSFDNLVPETRDWVLGRAGDDERSGTFRENLVMGFGGDDSLAGGAGNDVMVGDGSIPFRTGDDTMYGGLGNDVMGGNRGNDLMYGDDGDDMVIGGLGADELHGGDDNDTLIGDFGVDEEIAQALRGAGIPWPLNIESDEPIISTAATILTWRNDLKIALNDFAGDTAYNLGMDLIGINNDKIYGGGGADLAMGGEGADKFWGGEGSDLGIGGFGSDKLWGGTENDYLLGGQGFDRLFGETGDDFLFGGRDVDVLIGGVGNDFLQGGAGADRKRGGLGEDIFNIGDYEVEALNDDLAEEDQLPFVTGDDVLLDFEDGIDLIDLDDLEVNVATFAVDLAAAVSDKGRFNSVIDLDALGGDGSLTLRGVRSSEIDTSDFIGEYLIM